MNNNEQRNILRCPYCGLTILTKEYSRHCAKCNTLMIYLGPEKDKAKFICKPQNDR